MKNKGDTCWFTHRTPGVCLRYPSHPWGVFQIKSKPFLDRVNSIDYINTMEDQQEKFPQEKRRSPRVGGAVVEYFMDGEEASVKKAFIKDICIHGICILKKDGLTG